MVYSQNIRIFATEIRQSGGCSHYDVREFGENPRLYLQL